MKYGFVGRAIALQFACSVACADTKESELFPFVLPWDDATPGVVNLSGWLPKPAGRFGQVYAGADGHLYAGKERIRFFGVDLAFSANIPTHADAEKVAARLAKFGVNIVRFHIMDMRRFPEGILARDAAGTRDLDPEALDRLDYFISQLSRNGVYANLCLLNYRPLCAADGLPKEIELAGGDPYQRRHVVGFFNEQILELQKEYARKLLARKNAYTGRAYTADPAVAFVEINNENGLIHAWQGRQVDELPELFRNELKDKWNQWLIHCYGATEKVREMWSASLQPLGGELLANGDFARGTDGWTLERHAPANATADPADDTPASLTGGKSVRITVTQPGTQSWHVRFEQTGICVQAGQSYTLSFWAKADSPSVGYVSIEQTREPWHTLSARTEVALTAQWQQYRCVLPVGESDGQARAVLDPAMRAGRTWLAGVSLRPGGVFGLAPDERVEDGSVRAFTRAQFGERTAEAQRDWMRFLWETENRYWQAMYGYLKTGLQVQSLVIGTVVGCSTPNLMAKLDCIDTHAYWQHPVFPGRPWDPENWFVQNVSMVNDRGGVLPGLALRRVLDKPFCVTEYGNPAPNTFVSEGHVLRAAYAALQDWDYISASRYSHTSNWNLQCILNYFDINQHPTKMATLIPAAALYLRGDVKAARQLVVAGLGKEREIDALRQASAWELVHAGDAGVPREAALIHRVAIAAEGKSVPASALTPEQAQVAGDRFVSDTDELDWDLREQGRGVVTVNAERSKAVIGFGAGKRFDLGGVVIEPGATQQAGWSAITVTAMEGDFGKPPCRMLITATGRAENTGMGWKSPEKNTVGKDWGGPPTLVEGISARLTLPFVAQSVEIWSLDACGQRKGQLAVAAGADGSASVVLGPEQRTIWYEAVAK